MMCVSIVNVLTMFGKVGNFATHTHTHTHTHTQASRVKLGNHSYLSKSYAARITRKSKINILNRTIPDSRKLPGTPVLSLMAGVFGIVALPILCARSQ
jgi:hypothetical protein